MEKKRRFFNKNNFTLIEAVIVAGIFSVVGLTLLATFSSGLKIWQRVYKESSDEDVAIFFEKFSYDLRNTVKYNSIDFRGSKIKVSFATFIKKNSQFPGLSKGIGEVTYYWDKKNKKIFRVLKNLNDIYREKEGTTQLLLNNIDDFRINYYSYNLKEKKYFWKEEWNTKDIPLSVSLYISLRYKNSTFNYQRVVNIPLGEVKDWIQND